MPPPPESGLEEEEENGGMKYVKMIAKILFSHVGLAVLVCGYCVGGAFLFMHIEGEKEMTTLKEGMNRSQEIEAEREKLAEDLWMHKWSVDFNSTVENLLNEYHKNITDAIDSYGYSGYRINNTDEMKPGWSFPSALLFTVTIVTTIGYGHVAPKTEAGQLVVIFYSLLGIPLMLMFLANIGDAMANFFRIAYGRGCCYFCWKQRKRNYERNRKQQSRIQDAHHDKKRDAWDERDGKRRDSRDSDAEGKRNPIDAEEDPEEEVINVPISLTLVIIAAYIFIGAILFSIWNDWTWITGAYFSFVTLSTIGFGDLVPGWDAVNTTMGKVKLAISSFYIVLGLAVLSMSFNLMMEEMIAKFKWLGKKLGIVDDDAPPAPAAGEKAPLVPSEQPPAVDSRLGSAARGAAAGGSHM